MRGHVDVRWSADRGPGLRPNNFHLLGEIIGMTNVIFSPDPGSAGIWLCRAIELVFNLFSIV